MTVNLTKPIQNKESHTCFICLEEAQNPVICANESFEISYFGNNVLLEREIRISCYKAHVYCRECLKLWEQQKKECCVCKKRYNKSFPFDSSFEGNKDKISLVFRNYLIDIEKNDFTKKGFSKLTNEKKIKIINILMKTNNYDIINEIVDKNFKNFYSKNVLKFWKKLPYGPDYIETEIHEFSDFEKTFFLRFYIDSNPFIKNLKFLNLSNCNLSFLPEEINLFDQLEILYLHNNKLEYLFDDFGENFSCLQELYLNNNQIKKLPENFGDTLLHLKILCLDNNKLKNLPADFAKNFPKIVEISLNHNQLKKINQAFAKNSPNLETLTLHNNKIEELDSWFVQNLKNKNIKRLSLYRNPIKRFPENFYLVFELR